MKTEKEINILKTAERCLIEINKTEQHKKSLEFQFCRQLAHFCDRMAIDQENIDIRNKFIKYAMIFDKFAELFKDKGVLEESE